jgi:hypothetical protein
VYQASVLDGTITNIQVFTYEIGLSSRPDPSVDFKKRVPKPWTEGQCGRFTDMCICEADNRHAFARLMLCHREWCPQCGKSLSEEHRRRMARWMEKAQKMRSMCYVVITVPESEREKFKDIEYVRRIRRKIIRALKSRGYYLGLSRFHWFGDMTMVDPGGIERHRLSYDDAVIFCGEHPGWSYVAKFNPHINILMPRSWVNCDELKMMVAKILHIPINQVNLHAQYLRNQQKDIFKKMHRIKYVTRATFREYQWDSDFADSLWGFNNSMSWGSKKNWDKLPQAWEIPENERRSIKRFIDIENMICPICRAKLIRLKKFDPETGNMKLVIYEAKYLKNNEFFENAYGYLVRRDSV